MKDGDRITGARCLWVLEGCCDGYGRALLSRDRNDLSLDDDRSRRAAAVSRSAVLFTVGLVTAAAITSVGTYYFVNWISPPITQTMPKDHSWAMFQAIA